MVSIESAEGPAGVVRTSRFDLQVYTRCATFPPAMDLDAGVSVLTVGEQPSWGPCLLGHSHAFYPVVLSPVCVHGLRLTAARPQGL
jgi:hypothetical protein